MRDQVYNVMYKLDPEGLEACGGVGAKKEQKKENFTTRDPNWFTLWMTTTNLWATKTPHSLKQYIGAWIQQAGSCFGWGFGSKIPIHN